VGGFLRQQLELLQGRFPFIGDVRGKGLLLAVELVADRQSMEPLAPALNAHALLVELAYQRGLILYSRRTRGGIAGDHVMICPPMIVTREQVEHIVGLLADSLQALAEQLGLPLG
jgi:4-aminobutyrate aminotransferase-like enzyme